MMEERQMKKRKLDEESTTAAKSEADATEGMSILQEGPASKKKKMKSDPYKGTEESDVDLDNALAGLLSVSDTMRRLDKKMRMGLARKKMPKKVSHKSWTIIEEVFLVGVVVDMFLSRGSLSPKHYGESCWLVIKRHYDAAWAKYLSYLRDFNDGKISTEKEKELPFLKTMYHSTIDNHERTQGAMARHFKEMKDRCAKGTTRNFSYFLREWEEIYNPDFCLLPPSQSTNDKDVQAELELSKNPRLAALTRLGQNLTNYEGRWTHQDEVFLIAAVVNRFLKTGSLASPRGSADQACWNSIHENFEWLQLKAFEMGGQKPRPKRTVTALLRRFKLIKEHQTTKKSIRALYHDWKSYYCTEGEQAGGAPPHSPAHGSTVQQIVTIPSPTKPEFNNGIVTIVLPNTVPGSNNDGDTKEQAKETGEAAATLHALSIRSTEPRPPSKLAAPALSTTGSTTPTLIPVNGAAASSSSKAATTLSSTTPQPKRPPTPDSMPGDTGKVAEDGMSLDMRLVSKLKAVVDNRPAAKARVRIKWTAWDVSCLWNGIQLFGNSWSEIRKNFLPLRTTDQVKDKGKRLLRRVGWKTGRTKKFFDKASEEAKEIARLTCNKRSIPKIVSYNDQHALKKVANSGIEPLQEFPDCEGSELMAQYNALATEVAESIERKSRLNQTKATLECVIQEVVARARAEGTAYYIHKRETDTKTKNETVTETDANTDTSKPDPSATVVDPSETLCVSL